MISWRGRAVLGVLVGLGLSVGCAEGRRMTVSQPGVRPLGWVDVQLAVGVGLELGSQGPLDAVDRQGRTSVLPEGLGPSVPLTLSAGRLRAGARDLGPPPVELRPRPGAQLSLGRVRYRGLFRVDTDQGAGLRILNRLAVDDYLRGVVPKEMPDRFGLQALMAQAVAARSYALAEVGQRGWLYPDERSQVYGGIDAESALSSLAVQRTTGEVLTASGKVLSAWFHSTCGGGTRPARDLFPAAPVGVLDRPIVCNDCRAAPLWSWERRIPTARVCEAFGLPTAPLGSVRVDPPRFPGRPERLTVQAGGKQATLEVESFRARVSSGLGLPEQLPSSRLAAPPVVERGSLVLRGHGWGHGVGLCQYGAAGYAARGAGYRAILQRYYPGADLVVLQ